MLKNIIHKKYVDKYGERHKQQANISGSKVLKLMQYVKHFVKEIQLKVL